MGCKFAFAAVPVVLLSIAIIYIYQQFYAPLPRPKVDVTKYWGPSNRKNQVDSSAIHPFKVQYSAEVINELRKRLAEPLKLHESLEDVNFRYGFRKDQLQSLVKYWRDDYLPRWNEQQQYLNGLPQFQTEIQG